MLEKLKNGKKVVGTRRLIRAIEAGEISEIFLARDADLFIRRQVTDAANSKGIRITEVDTMKLLGEACGVEVKTASAGLLA
ncbi:MAG: ribosomal L7Ae/L30e/S12e/Gadd45 family protein [Clostridia bacterium]|nr:ribosomal L7Ae/L30e/S12e/Gadd45 family protein [Clostridia bacterium]